MKKGFTLVETLIAVSIFTIAAVIASTIFVDTIQLEKKSSVQTTIYEDVRIILQQIINEIQNGTIDYEEYYSVYVIQADKVPTESYYYGINYGAYGSRFYDPGRTLPAGGIGQNPKDLGVECSVYVNESDPESGCEIIYTHSSDLNTGQHPYDAANPIEQALSSAFCHGETAPGIGHCGSGEFSELFLIDNSGTQKTIIGKKKIVRDNWAVGLMKMEGRDIDQNGIVDIFSCAEEFNCFNDADEIINLIKYPFVPDGLDGIAYITNNGISIPQASDLNVAFDGNIAASQFIPISPRLINIKELSFVITPDEDPYKAYAETSVQSHPSVTIMLTAELSDAAAKDYPGDFSDITVQATVTAGVLGKIDSYPPASDVLSLSEDSWLCEILPVAISGGC